MSRTELELSSTTRRAAELKSSAHRTDLSDSILLRQTVRSRGPPHRSLRQDWKRFLSRSTIRLCHVRGAAIVALSGHPPGTQCIRRDPRTPRVGTPMQALSQVLDVPRGRSCHAPLPRASSCLTRRLTMMPAEAGSGREPIRTSEPSRLALSR